MSECNEEFRRNYHENEIEKDGQLSFVRFNYDDDTYELLDS